MNGDFGLIFLKIRIWTLFQILDRSANCLRERSKNELKHGNLYVGTWNTPNTIKMIVVILENEEVEVALEVGQNT